MAVEVERFDVDQQPEVGRPLVARFGEKGKGSLNVRVQRDDGSLWLWAMGPQGGDHGHVAFGVNRARGVVDFANAITSTDGRYGVGPSMGGGDYALRVRRPWKDRAIDEETTDRLVSITKGMGMRSFALRFDAAALDELRTCLRTWASVALAKTADPPRAGDFYGRGQMPHGTPEQIRAWLVAAPEGPKGRLVQIRDDATDGHVIYREVLTYGALGSAFRVPLVDFYGGGWTRIA